MNGRHPRSLYGNERRIAAIMRLTTWARERLGTHDSCVPSIDIYTDGDRRSVLPMRRFTFTVQPPLHPHFPQQTGFTFRQHQK